MDVYVRSFVTVCFHIEVHGDSTRYILHVAEEAGRIEASDEAVELVHVEIYGIVGDMGTSSVCICLLIIEIVATCSTARSP